MIHERRASENSLRDREEGKRGREGKDGRQRQIAAFNRLPWGDTEGDRERERHIWKERDAREREKETRTVAGGRLEKNLKITGSMTIIGTYSVYSERIRPA